MSTPAASGPKSGLYVAHHRWLDVECGPGRLHKVGHTGNLGGRLNDSAYVTNFPPGWAYVATFEVASKEEAFLLETAVLHCCRHRRLGTRELVRMTAAEIIAVAEAVARELQLTAVRRDRPEYPATARGGGGTGVAAPTDPAEPTAWAASKPRIDRFTVPPELTVDGPTGGVAGLTMSPAAPELTVDDLTDAIAGLTLSGPPRLPAAPDLSDTIDDILSWDFSGVKPEVAPTKPAKPQVADPQSSQDMIIDEVDDFAFAGAMDVVEAEIASSPFDLRSAPAPIEVRGYQREATALCVRELRANGRAILQMACRCGKTPVAYGVLCEFLASGAADERPVAALYLVPGLSLLRQTAQKLASYGFAEPMLLVGSDPRPVPMPGGRELTMTTDPAVVRAFLSERGRRLVVSTYQSSPQVPTDAFELTVFDECHRVCGGRAPRPFNHFVLAPRVGARLYMTATPAYDPPSKAAISMKDRELFGGVAFRYHLRQGIAAGYVNDFRLEIVAAPSDRATPAAEEAAIPGQLLAAMGKVDKLLVFCRDIRHATRLCETLQAALQGDAQAAGVAPFECLVAHSRMGSGGAAGALRRFAEPGVRSVLFNCRLFQEGVEIPALNGVFFASPRHSPRDIIQSVCRPLNRWASPSGAGKPVSVIFLPILHDPARAPTDPANLKRYASIVPFVDALLDEDPRLYEHLLDPTASPYPVDILGTHTLALADARARGALLSAVRRAVRYGASTSARPAERLLRVENVPWDRAFAEVRRVVTTCGRYPKTTDAWVVGEARVCLHRFYRWAADEYVAWRSGRPSKLEPHQIHDLQSLPGWEPYGVEGPYPWRLCMDFLEQWLREHGGVAPMCEINKGGYVGLEATAIERLSGALTCVNQADGKARKGKAPDSGYTLSAEKQADLERICKPWGLRWRKERDASGALVKNGPQTFIQEAYSRFKAYYKAHGPEGEYIQRWFPGYPLKHARQENLEVQKAGTAPPRWRQGRRKKGGDSDAEDE